MEGDTKIMAKTQEELNALKEEVVTLNEKLHELTEEELAQVTGGGCILDFDTKPASAVSGDGFVLSRPHDDLYE